MEAAGRNAALNGIGNVEFICADLKDVLKDLIKKQLRAVICDPSRAGIGSQSCSLLGRLKKKTRLCYIFCSKKAFRRDLPVLLSQGFSLKKVTIYDMFPYTRMQETVAFLEKK